MTLCKEIARQRQTLQEHNMQNVFHKKGWKSGTNPEHVEPLPVPLIKATYNIKSDKDFVKLKLCRDPMFSTSDLYEFRMYLFDRGKTE